jgi:UDP-N-acetylmuramoyl-tripeptide--D-alanyl-D-alanine ligase
MIKLSLKELIQVTQGELLTKGFNNSSYMEGVSIDSRTLKKGNLFVALEGENYNGHDFIPHVITAGVSCVLVKKAKVRNIDESIKGEIALIGVDDTRKALQDLGSWYRKKFSVKTVAITGSNGKTTTKDMTAEVLSTRYKVIKSPQSYNTRIGVPLTLFNLSSEVEVLVVELGASKLGEIEMLTRISLPDIGVITNITSAHLEFFGSFDNVIQAKFELLENMPQDKTAVLNIDDESLFNRMKREKKKVVTYGIDKKADFRAEDITFSDRGEVGFKINGKMRVQLKLVGKHNVYNALAAFAVGDLLGIDKERIAQVLRNFTSPHLRMEPVEFEGIRVINDSYNANPSSMENALNAIRQIKTSGRKVAVLGDMLELGEKSETFHRELGERVVESGIDLLITVGQLAKWIGRGAKKRGLENSSNKSFEDKGKVIQFLRQSLEPGDLVLVKGSRRLKLEDLVEDLRRIYSNQS